MRSISCVVERNNLVKIRHERGTDFEGCHVDKHLKEVLGTVEEMFQSGEYMRLCEGMNNFGRATDGVEIRTFKHNFNMIGESGTGLLEKESESRGLCNHTLTQVERIFEARNDQ